MGNGKHAPPPGGPQDKAQIEAVLDRIGRRVKELRTFDTSGIQDRWDARLEVLQKNVNNTIAEAVGMGSAQYRQLSIGPLDAALESAFGDRYTVDEVREEIRRALGQAVMRLNAAAKVLERRLAGGGADSSFAGLPDAPASNFGALSSGYPPPASNFAPLAAEPAPPRPPKRPAASAPALAAAREPAAVPAPEPQSAPAPAREAAPALAPAPVPVPEAAPAPVAERAPAPAPALQLPPPSPASTPRMHTPASTGTPFPIALVCRDDSSAEAVTSFVAQLGLEPLIAQQPGAQSGSLEALEPLRQAQYALVLQADRQLEIGFLLGALGRSRLCVLQAPGGQDSLPGLPHHVLDEGGLWKLLLARELKKSGLDVDLNKAI